VDPPLFGNGRVPAHGIHGDHAAVAGEPLQECGNGRHLIRCSVGVALPHDETTLLRPPCRAQVSWRTCRGPLTCGLHGLAIEGDQRPLHELRHGLRPGEDTCLKALRIEAGKHTATGGMGGHAMGQSEAGLEPGTRALAKEFHVLEPFSAGRKRTHGNDQASEEVVLLRPLNTRILSRLEMLDNRRAHRASPGPAPLQRETVGSRIAELGYRGGSRVRMMQSPWDCVHGGSISFHREYYTGGSSEAQFAPFCLLSGNDQRQGQPFMMPLLP
jgi:hypothetical protein